MLAATLFIAHGVAVALIVLIDLPLWLELAAVAALVVNCGREAWRKALLRSPDSVVAIEIASDEALSIQTRRGEWAE
jgi:toxin CptA